MGSDDNLLGLLGRWYFLQFEALRVNGEGGMLSTGSGGGSSSALFISVDGSSSLEEETSLKALLPPGASMDGGTTVFILSKEEMGLWEAGRLWSSEGTVFDQDASRAGFRFSSDVLSNWSLFTTLTSVDCLPINGKENYMWSHKMERD